MSTAHTTRGQADRPHKVAIIHDWLVGGGAERVVEQLHQLYPDAPIYTSYCSDEWRKKLDNKIVTGYLQHWPFSKLRRLAVIMSWPRIWWFNGLDLSSYDVVISSAGNGEAKDITTKGGTLHICYCHAPTHYYWRKYQEYLGNPGFGPLNFLARIGLRFFVKPLRKRDYRAAQKPDIFIANSTFIAKEIKKDYNRNATVINPPLDVRRFKNAKTTEHSGLVTVGRQVLYKRTDLLVDACSQLNIPLTVIGNGPEHANLIRRAGPNITFLTNVNDIDVVEHLASAEAFLFAAEEDFGIAPLEAMATGTPVIAYKAGGALDYVIEGKTGILFEDQTVESLKQAIAKLQKTTFNHKVIKQHADSFSDKHFRQKMDDLITQSLAKKT